MNMKNRLFQHYEGEVKEIEGLTLKGLRSLVDSESAIEDVIVLWIRTEHKWLRIFIDGCYCGIDEYETDEIEHDLLEKNLDDWVDNLTIKKTYVKSEGMPLITLSIDFTNAEQLLFHCDENEKCSLIKTGR